MIARNAMCKAKVERRHNSSISSNKHATTSGYNYTVLPLTKNPTLQESAKSYLFAGRLIKSEVSSIKKDLISSLVRRLVVFGFIIGAGLYKYSSYGVLVPMEVGEE